MTDLNSDGSLPVSNGIAFQTVAEIKVGEPVLFPWSRFERRMVLAPAGSPAASQMHAHTPDTTADQIRCAFLRAFIYLGYNLFRPLISTLRRFVELVAMIRSGTLRRKDESQLQEGVKGSLVQVLPIEPTWLRTAYGSHSFASNA